MTRAHAAPSNIDAQIKKMEKDVVTCAVPIKFGMQAAHGVCRVLHDSKSCKQKFSFSLEVSEATTLQFLMRKSRRSRMTVRDGYV